MLLEDLLAVRKENSKKLLRGVVNTAHWGATPDMETDWVQSDKNYPFYAALAFLVKPMSVLEIGVRLGYSLISMFRGYDGILKIVGVDLQADVEDSQRKARENLVAVGYKKELELPVVGSRWIKSFGSNVHFNLVHVDGDHSREGAREDIRMAWPKVAPGGILVADDAEYAPGVKEGVEEIKPKLPGLGQNFYVDTFRGWWVAQKV